MASKRIKPKAPEPFKTREEFERGIDQIARWDIDIKRLEAELKKRHQELDDEFGPEIREKAKAPTGSPVRRGSERAMAAKQTVISACIITIHQRLVRTTSTSGLQRGFITHGR